VHTLAFGSTLRRARLRNGITLDEIAERSKVKPEVWEALENNDLTAWPSGVYARSYIKTYAEIVGLDPQQTIDEFCRSFPNGDRRAEPVIRGYADIVQAPIVWEDDFLPEDIEDRRASASNPEKRFPRTQRSRRLLAAGLDLAAVFAVSGAAAAIFRGGFRFALPITALVYHAGSLIVEGCTPGVWLVDAYVSKHTRHPIRLKRPLFLRFRQTTDKA
jgi:cytoskeletal protein RodZ